MRGIFTPSAGFELTMPEIERLQTYAFDSTVTGIGRPSNQFFTDTYNEDTPMMEVMYIQVFALGGIRIKFCSINARRKLLEKFIFVVTNLIELTLEASVCIYYTRIL